MRAANLRPRLLLVFLARAAPPCEQSPKRARAIVIRPGQQRRNRASRDKWQDVKLQQTAVATLARPHKTSELRALSSKDILQPEGGFMHLLGLRLAVSEHCAKTGKKVTSSNSRKPNVGAAKLKLRLPLGINDQRLRARSLTNAETPLGL